MEEKKIEFIESTEDFLCPFCGSVLNKILVQSVNTGGFLGKSFFKVCACPVCKKVIPVMFTA